MKKELIPVLPKGEQVICHLADTAQQESSWIAGQIADLCSRGIAHRDIAILYRAHYVTRPVEEELIRQKIPYVVYSGVQFFGRAEIKDALCYLRMLVYRDDLSFRRIVNQPRRNIGVRRMHFLEQWAQAHGCTLYEALQDTVDQDIFKGTGAADFIQLIDTMSAAAEGKPVSEVLAAIVNESGYEEMLRTEGSQERLDNLAELKQSAFEYETTCGEEVTLESYLNHIALFTNADTGDAGDRVKLMTVHTAKGLEFPYVFLCAMNEGIFPSRKTRTEEGMEEERRLAYVAITRAQKQLFLSEAGGRNFDGSPRYPSRFLLEIKPECMNFTRPPTPDLIRRTKHWVGISDRMLRPAGESLFEVGTQVIHSVFGEGTVKDIDMDKSAYVIEFDGLPTPRSISFRAKLTEKKTDGS